MLSPEDKDWITEALRTGLQASEERMASLIATEVGNLHSEMVGVEQRLTTRLESIDARLKLQAGLLQAGARAMARFEGFAESSEERWVALVGRVEALEKKMESKQ